MKMIEIENTLQNLKNSPLFYLFVSSRELFHSNFWYWLSTLNPQATTKLFTGNNCTTENLLFHREHNQRNGNDKSKVDLFITNDKDINIVIENKIKDFPKIEQLERIKKSFSETNADFVLVTLFHCDDIKFDGWTIRSYEKLVEQLNSNEFTENNYYKNLINDYKQFTQNLVLLSNSLNLELEYNFAISYNKELFKKLNEIKLWEGYQKLRASHLITKYLEVNTFEIDVCYGVNNQKATIDFVLELKDNYRIGIQLEDNQFRKFIIGEKHIEFAESLRKSNLFFDYQWESPRKKTMLRYNPDFQYQYEKIEIQSFDELFSKIDDEIQSIIDQREEIELKIPATNI